MRQHLTGILLALAASGVPASAQDVWDEPGGIETETAYQVAAVAASEAGGSILYTIRGSFAANYVLENGAEIGARASGGFDRDNPERTGFSGVVGPATPAPGPAGAFSGLARGPLAEDAGARGRVETAYIYIDGGYGELRAGLDEGVAARFFEGGPSPFRHAALANPTLDPTGRVFARTDHDLTGPSLKVSYATPRLLGLRAGVSLAPEANSGGLDRDPVRDLIGVPGPKIENALELALNLSRRLPRSGVRLRAAAAWSEADAEAAALPGVYEAVETWSTGGSVEFSSSAFGLSYLSSNNGTVGGGGDYSALSAALRLTLGKYDVGIEAVDAEDTGLGAESDAYSLSLGRNLSERVRLVGGWQRLNSRFTGSSLPVTPATSDETNGIVIEITLSG